MTINELKIEAFQMIEGNSERMIVSLRGEEGEKAFNTFVNGRGIDVVCDMIGNGEIDVVDFEGKTYFNLYI